MENEKKYQKIYVAEYENANAWTREKKDILSKIQPGNDFFLIFQTGKGGTFPSPTVQEVIMEMGDNKELISCPELEDHDYIVHIESMIKKYASKTTYVYFLAMDETCLRVKSDMDGEVAGIEAARNFLVGRRKTDKKKSNKMGGGKNPKHNTAKPSSDNDNSDLFFVLNNEDVNPEVHYPKNDSEKEETNNSYYEVPPKQEEEKIFEPEKEHPDKENEREQKETTPENKDKSSEEQKIGKEEKKKKEEEKSKIDFGSKKTDPLDVDKEPPKTDKKGNEEQQVKNERKEPETEKKEPKSEGEKKEENQRRFGSATQGNCFNKKPNESADTVQGEKPSGNQTNRRMTGKKPMQQSPSSSAPNMSLQELEDLIFGVETEKMDFSRVYTDWDNSRADTISKRIDVFKEKLHKCTTRPQELGFNDELYNMLIQVLVKSKDYKDFIESWHVVYPEALGLEEKNYHGLYIDAVEIMNIANALYS